MKKIIIILIVVFSVATSGFGQQFTLRSQYIMDLSMVNPAIAGIHDYTYINLSYRQQWTGFNGAPVTQYLNVHKDVGGNVGIGLSIFNELTTPTRRTGIQATFSYHLPLSRDNKKTLSFGLSPVLFQHFIDASLLTPEQLNDPAVIRGVNQQLSPDLNFGTMFTYNNQFFVGISVFNMLQLRRDLFQMMDKINNPIMRAYYFVSGYTFNIDDTYYVTPSTLVQYQYNTPFQFDVNLKVDYKKIFGIGTSYRHLDAVVFMAFIYINDFTLGYSYDMTLSEIKKYSSGSHEVHITYRFKNNNGGKGSKYGPLPCPAYH